MQHVVGLDAGELVISNEFVVYQYVIDNIQHLMSLADPDRQAYSELSISGGRIG